MSGNIRNGRTTFPHKIARQVGATERQEKYSKLSLDEKIALQEGKGYAGKQLSKLLLKKAAQAFMPAVVEETKLTSTGKLTQEQKHARKSEHKANVKNLNKDR